jgi:hypothetical protein
VITPKDLENAEPKIRRNDILMINTGSHLKYGDNPDYYAYSPGLYKEAAEWIVERGVKLVGVDVQALDHPLGTFLGPHGPGPAQPHLDVEYKAETGRHIIEDFPHWEPRDNHDDERHPGYREHWRRHRQDHRQALHVLRVPVALAGWRGLCAACGRDARSEAEFPIRAGAVI